MLKKFHVLLFFVFAILPVFLIAEGKEAESNARVKYIFLLIGDGFGPNQRTVSELALEKKLLMNTAEYIVVTGTNTIDNKTTDSAASGTAIACGLKTKTLSVGVDPNGRPVESLASALKRKGYSVGIISSCGMTDGTPAAFFAHQFPRYKYREIADDMVASDFDFFGGFGIFESPDIGNREALEVEYREKLRKSGRKILETPESIEGLSSCEKVYAISVPYTEWAKSPSFLSGIFAEKRLTLTDFLKKTVSLFESNPKGFFIMLECGRLDHAGHNHDAGMTIRETRSFDNAIAAALAFQAKHPAETLIVFTADHETGGLQIEDQAKLKENVQLLWKQTKPLEDAGEEIQPMFKQTNCSDEKIAGCILDVIGIDFTDAEKQEILTLVRQSRTPVKGKPRLNAFQILVKAAAMRDMRLGLRYTSKGHTNAKILTSGFGPGARLFNVPNLQNSDIRGIIERIMAGER